MKIARNTNNKNSVLKTKWLWWLLGGVGVLLIGGLGLQRYGKYLISNKVSEELPAHLELNYDDLDFNILLGNVVFNNVQLKSLNLKTEKVEGQITLKTLKINDVAYWDLWKNKQFNTDAIKVKDANIVVFKTDSEAIKFSVNDVSFEVTGFKTDALQLQNKIPFTYSALDLALTDLFLDLSRFEMLNLATLSYNNNTLKFEDLAIASKYDKKELSQKLTIERDYVDFKVSNGTAKALRLKTVNDSFQVSAQSFRLNHSELHLFRDKLLPDDSNIKQLYGTKLRNLPFQLDIETFFIENANVFYSERVDEVVDPVSIAFENLDAKIDNLSNMYNKNTEIEVTTKLMGEAPLEFKWNFNVRDTADVFNASAVLKDLEAGTINPFLESQAKVRALGRIHEMYFTIHGNNFNSTGDMKMNYEDFKFSILDEDQLRINKTLTALVNIFTNDGSKTNENGYRFGDINVERDKTKSFFNYLWVNTKDGLKNTVVGNGKK